MTFAFALFVVPFLRRPSGAPDEAGDFGRVSEVDVPFATALGQAEEELGLELAADVAAASEARFGFASHALATSELLELRRLRPGRDAYELHCSGCHGATGDGGGSAARYLAPRPRNFRRGVFKFTSTPTGDRPLRSDLLGTITRGLAGSSMPGFPLLPAERRADLVEYVRYLAIRGEFEELMLELTLEDEELADPDEVAEIVTGRWSPAVLRAVYPATPEPPEDEASIARGSALFLDVAGGNCAACHGPEGRGDGPSAAAFLDDWGYPIEPRDLTTGVYRAGGEPGDLWRSIATGVKGTPMGSFGGALESDEIWDLVHFVRSLAR